jgi:hypothetical protein
MKAFLGLMFLTGIVRKPEIEMYWTVDEALETPFFGKVMPRNRFELIWSFFHTANNEETDPDDRMFKVRKLLDLLTTNFAEQYTPGQNISIDEGMLLWRGRLSFR